MLKKIKFAKNKTLFSGQTIDFCNENGEPCKYILLIGDNGVGKTTLLNMFFDLESNPNKIYELAEWAQFSNMRENWRNNSFGVGNIYPFRGANFICMPSLGIINNNTNQNYANDTEYNNWNSLYKLLTSICESDREMNENGEIEDPYKELHNFNNLANSFLQKDTITLGYKYKSPGANQRNISESYTFYINKKKTVQIKTASSGLQKAIYWAAILYDFNENDDDTNSIHLVDEPENDWHPQLQIEFSKNFMPNTNKQIIIATHSPFIVESFLKYHRQETLLIWIRKDDGALNISHLLKGNESFVLPSISLAEINYLVYGIKSIDYHCMLYGTLQNLYIDEDVKFTSISCFDKKLIQLAPETQYIKTNDPHRMFQPKTSLMTYVRNCIDHPENAARIKYTNSELELSIHKLRELIKAKREEEIK